MQGAGAALARSHERLEALVHYVLLVYLLENVGPDHRMQICLHILEDQVNVAVIVRLQHILELHDVLVVAHLLQEDDLAVSALRVCGVLERIKNLLERHHVLRLLVMCLPPSKEVFFQILIILSSISSDTYFSGTAKKFAQLCLIEYSAVYSSITRADRIPGK